MDFRVQQNRQSSVVCSAAITSWQRPAPLRPTPWLELESSLLLTFCIYLLGEQVCLSSLGSVPQGGPFTLMKTHNKREGWTKKRASELFAVPRWGWLILSWLWGCTR